MEKKLTSPQDIQKAHDILKNIRDQVDRYIIGQDILIDRILYALLADGHILLEGVPGLAKTRTINVLAQAINGIFQRIQFTPDLLPSDIIGNLVFNPKDAEYSTKKGPVFSNFLLADEINRAPAKVQSALLEAMQEKQVTIGDKTYKLPSPFFVMATQNPIDNEGTYPLPEAQVDRFLLKTVITYPSLEEEAAMLDLVEKEEELDIKNTEKLESISFIKQISQNIYVDLAIKKYIVNLVNATRNPKDYSIPEIADYIEFGASPRASIAFMRVAKVIALMANRDHVIPDDIKLVAQDILRHRIILTYSAEAEGVKHEDVINQVLNFVKVP